MALRAISRASQRLMGHRPGAALCTGAVTELAAASEARVTTDVLGSSRWMGSSGASSSSLGGLAAISTTVSGFAPASSARDRVMFVPARGFAADAGE